LMTIGRRKKTAAGRRIAFQHIGIDRPLLTHDYVKARLQQIAGD